MTILPNSSCFVLLDYSKVHTALLEILSFDIIGFVGYAALLYIYCNLLDGLVCFFLLLSTQLVIGMIVTRLHYTFGENTRCKTQFIDPSFSGMDWKIERENLKLEDLENIIESAYLQIPEPVSENIDDYNDITWFTIILWSLFSSVIASFFPIDSKFCITGSLITAFVCLVIFVNGYNSADLDYLRDDLNYLEFYILDRLSKLQSVTNGFRKNMFVEWRFKNNKYILNDLGYVFRIDHPDNEYCSVSYLLGLPSQMNERIEIVGGWNSDSQFAKKLEELISKSNWDIEVESSENYILINCEHKIKSPSFTTKNMSSINIDSVVNASQKITDIVKAILNACITHRKEQISN